MATQVKHRRGNTVGLGAFTPALGELIMNTDTNELVLGDGVKVGGHKIGGYFISVRQFGAIGDGATDDTAAMNAAAEYAYNNNLGVYIPEGEYVMYAPFVSGVNVIGAGYDRTKITFPEGFVNPIPDSGFESRYFVMYNKNYIRDYDEATADTFVWSGFHIHVDMILSEPRTAAILGTSNTKGARLTGIKLTSAPDIIDGARTCMSFYDGNQDLDISYNVFENNSNKSTGGCIWLQGGSGRTDATKGTKNVRIHDNVFYQTRPYNGDECIGLYGAGGRLEDVDVYNNTLYLDGGGQGISVFNTANSSETISLCDNIRIRDNILRTDLQFNSIRIGGQFLPDFLTNLSVTGNKIFMESPNTGSSYCIRCTDTGDDTLVKDNVVTNIGAGQISRGIAGDPNTGKAHIYDNTVVGDFYYGVQYAYVCRGNRVDGANFAIEESFDVRNNYLTDVKTYGVRLTLDGDGVIADNRIEMAIGHNYPLYATSAMDGDLTIRNNDVICQEAAVRCMRLENTGQTVVLDNKFTGVGLEPNVSNMIDRAVSNYYFGVYDDLAASAGAGLAGLRLCLPIGHMIRNNNPSVSSNRILAGWVLDNARAWQTVYMDTV